MKVKKIAEAQLPTRHGDFRILGFETEDGQESCAVLVRGDLASREAPLVRIHSQCLTGDTLGSLRCDCGAQLQEALRLMAREDCGVLVYQPQEGRGIGLMNKLVAYELQDQGVDTVEANEQLGFLADERDYAFCVALLAELGLTRIRLLSNNPKKVEAFRSGPIQVLERVPLEIAPSERAREYLKVKKEKMGHLLSKI
ncbi:MAG: GTP cyclohydrolase II [Acidobacteria bacterium]|nr:GTP cyclohydrolase II [Acidobacteriota bacterium]